VAQKGKREDEGVIQVVVPTSSRPHTVGRAIESLLKQRSSEWECAIVKNGPSHLEEYREVLKGFLSDERFTIIYTPVASLPRSLNLGARLSRSELVAVLEDDDEWHPRFLSSMSHEIVQREHTGAVYCDQTEVYQGQEVNWVGAQGGPFDRARLLSGNWIAFPMVLFRRECLEDVGGFDERCGGATDWDTWLRMSRDHGFRHVRQNLVTHHWLDDRSNLCLQEKHMQKANAYIRYKRSRGYYG
jgi:glycosyltransferase involved in cell wall biosynthesis